MTSQAIFQQHAARSKPQHATAVQITSAPGAHINRLFLPLRPSHAAVRPFLPFGPRVRTRSNISSQNSEASCQVAEWPDEHEVRIEAEGGAGRWLSGDPLGSASSPDTQDGHRKRCSYICGSVLGARSNPDPYRDWWRSWSGHRTTAATTVARAISRNR